MCCLGGVGRHADEREDVFFILVFSVRLLFSKILDFDMMSQIQINLFCRGIIFDLKDQAQKIYAAISKD